MVWKVISVNPLYIVRTIHVRIVLIMIDALKPEVLVRYKQHEMYKH